MKIAKLTVTVLVGAMFMFTAATLTASDPVGIYAIVEKVIFEPSEAAPQRVQIWGAFAFADTTRGGDYYTKPQVGYLYYTLPAGNEAIARKEWADLKSVAGTGQGVAFGRRYWAARKGSSGFGEASFAGILFTGFLLPLVSPRLIPFPVIRAT